MQCLQLVFHCNLANSCGKDMSLSSIDHSPPKITPCSWLGLWYAQGNTQVATLFQAEVDSLLEDSEPARRQFFSYHRHTHTQNHFDGDLRCAFFCALEACQPSLAKGSPANVKGSPSLWFFDAKHDDFTVWCSWNLPLKILWHNSARFSLFAKHDVLRDPDKYHTAGGQRMVQSLPSNGRKRRYPTTYGEKKWSPLYSIGSKNPL